MRTNLVLSLVAGSVLATLFAGSSFAATNKVFPSKTKTYDITFDGYCDGMNLTISNKVDVVGPSTGCSAGFVDVGFTATRGGIKFLDISSNDNGGGEALIFVFNYPGTGNGWCAYNTTDGVTLNVINCGTYSIGAPGPRGPNRSTDRLQ